MLIQKELPPPCRLSFSNEQSSSKIYKRDDFEIINFSFLDEDVPRSPRALHLMVYIFHSLIVLQARDFNNRNKFLTKLIKQGYQYHKSHKALSKLRIL